MPAHKNLNDTQFTYSYVPGALGDEDNTGFGGANSHRVIAKTSSGEYMGRMDWDAHPKGTVSSIWVEPQHRRKGLATRMYNQGVGYANLVGTSKPGKSEIMSTDGEALSKSIFGDE